MAAPVSGMLVVAIGVEVLVDLSSGLVGTDFLRATVFVDCFEALSSSDSGLGMGMADG